MVVDEDGPGLRVGVVAVSFTLTYQPWQFAREVWKRERVNDPQPAPPPENDDESNSVPAPEELDHRRDMNAWHRRMAAAYQTAVADELESAAPGTRWRVPPTGPLETRGPGGDAIALLVEATDVLEDIMAWVGLATTLHLAARKLKSMESDSANGGDRIDGSWPGEGAGVEIGDGTAAAFGAEAIVTVSKDEELDFAFVTAINSRPPSIYGPEGYLVGYRSANTLWTATVTMYGDVLDVSTMPMPPEMPSWWRAEGRGLEFKASSERRSKKVKKGRRRRR